MDQNRKTSTHCKNLKHQASVFSTVSFIAYYLLHVYKIKHLSVYEPLLSTNRTLSIFTSINDPEKSTTCRKPRLKFYHEVHAPSLNFINFVN